MIIFHIYSELANRKNKGDPIEGVRIKLRSKEGKHL